MRQILEAIQGGASGEEIAALPIPETYRAAHVLRREQDMWEGVPSEDKDPRKSLHVGEVPTPELAPDEVYLAVMASSINFNTVWTSIFEPLPTFGFLDRLGGESSWAARPCATGSRATGWPSIATTSTTRIPPPTTTPCSPPTSASGASSRTTAGWPTSRSSRRTSSWPSPPTSPGRRRPSTGCAPRPATACSSAATPPA